MSPAYNEPPTAGEMDAQAVPEDGIDPDEEKLVRDCFAAAGERIAGLRADQVAGRHVDGEEQDELCAFEDGVRVAYIKLGAEWGSLAVEIQRVCGVDGLPPAPEGTGRVPRLLAVVAEALVKREGGDSRCMKTRCGLCAESGARCPWTRGD
jgi:hypothetical protein